MSNDGDRSAQPGARFAAEGTMKVDPQGVYAPPSDRATVTVSLELAGEALDRFRSFVGRGYPQVPHSEPPTKAGSFEEPPCGGDPAMASVRGAACSRLPDAPTASCR